MHRFKIKNLHIHGNNNVINIDQEESSDTISKQKVLDIISEIQNDMYKEQNNLNEKDKVLLGNFIKGQLEVCKKILKEINK